MEGLLAWLRGAEAQLDGGVAGMEKMAKAGKDGSHDQLTQQLSLCKASCLNCSNASRSITNSSTPKTLLFVLCPVRSSSPL